MTEYWLEWLKESDQRKLPGLPGGTKSIKIARETAVANVKVGHPILIIESGEIIEKINGKYYSTTSSYKDGKEVKKKIQLSTNGTKKSKPTFTNSPIKKVVKKESKKIAKLYGFYDCDDWSGSFYNTRNTLEECIKVAKWRLHQSWANYDKYDIYAIYEYSIYPLSRNINPTDLEKIGTVILDRRISSEPKFIRKEETYFKKK